MNNILKDNIKILIQIYRLIQQSKYDQYQYDVDGRNSLKRGRSILSPFVMGYGLAVIAYASMLKFQIIKIRTSC